LIAEINDTPTVKPKRERKRELSLNHLTNENQWHSGQYNTIT